MTDQERNALILARSDLWFLLNYNDIPNAYRTRATATAEYITRTLGDEKEFSVILDRWFKEAVDSGNGLYVSDSKEALAEVRYLGRRPA